MGRNAKSSAALAAGVFAKPEIPETLVALRLAVGDVPGEVAQTSVDEARLEGLQLERLVLTESRFSRVTSQRSQASATASC